MGEWARLIDGKLLSERALDGGGSPAKGAGAGRPARSRTVNLAESPLGWLHARAMSRRANLTPASGCGRTGSARSSTRK